jgi:hypothetical protein
MPDGTIRVGLSPFSGKVIYSTPSDAPLTMTFEQATEYCANLDAHGHSDWRLPTPGELDEMYNNRAAIGGFYTTPSEDKGWYWSSQRNDIPDTNVRLAVVRHLPDGDRRSNYTSMLSHVRCVRSDSKP